MAVSRHAPTLKAALKAMTGPSQWLQAHSCVCIGGLWDPNMAYEVPCIGCRKIIIGRTCLERQLATLVQFRYDSDSI